MPAFLALSCISFLRDRDWVISLQRANTRILTEPQVWEPWLRPSSVPQLTTYRWSSSSRRFLSPTSSSSKRHRECHGRIECKAGSCLTWDRLWPQASASSSQLGTRRAVRRPTYLPWECPEHWSAHLHRKARHRSRVSLPWTNPRTSLWIQEEALQARLQYKYLTRWIILPYREISYF